MTPESNLLKRIKDYMRLHKIPETTFGSRAVGDCGLVSDLKKGRELRRKTVQRIENFLSGPENNGKSAPSRASASRKEAAQ